MCYLCDCNPIDIPEEHDCCDHDPPDCADKPQLVTPFANEEYTFTLYAALLKYGRHERGCAVFMPSDSECSCGWEGILDLLKLGAKE